MWLGKVGVIEYLGFEIFLYVNVDGVGMLIVKVGGDCVVNYGDII